MNLFLGNGTGLDTTFLKKCEEAVREEVGVSVGRVKECGVNVISKDSMVTLPSQHHQQ